MNIRMHRAWSTPALTLAFLVGLLAACQDDGSTITTGASPLPQGTQTARVVTTGSSASRSGPSDIAAEDGPSDDSSTDHSSDDVSDDADEDHANDDVTETEADNENEDEVKGLFFGIEACPTAECIVALRIKDKLVVVTSSTRIVNQAAGDQLILPSDLESLVAAHLGLPMKAEGFAQGDVLVATELRIQDEIRATGDVVPGTPGCDFGLVVRAETLCFVLSPGLTPPMPGTNVRVEGRVASDFTLPFVATSIRPAAD